MACKCIRDLTIEQKEIYLKKFLSESAYLNERTEIIVIYSKIRQNTRVCLNTVTFEILPGLNKICICRLANKHGKTLRIAANYLCKLEKIQTIHFGVEIFVLKGYHHQISCQNTQVPTLVELSFFQLFIQGKTNNNLTAIYKRGEIPKELYERRMKIRYHMGYFSFNSWFCLACPSVSQVLPSCRFPQRHLQINI